MGPIIAGCLATITFFIGVLAGANIMDKTVEQAQIENCVRLCSPHTIYFISIGGDCKCSNGAYFDYRDMLEQNK